MLPEGMTDMPIQIIKGKMAHNNLVLKVVQLRNPLAYHEPIKKKFAFVWQNDIHVKIMMDDILWIQADHGYSILKLRNGKEMTVSFNLSFISKKLPKLYFMRIHKSFIVNLKHVESFRDNMLFIGNTKLPISRMGKKRFMDHFEFIGIRGETK